MKTYIKTICVGNFYNYAIYKITDYYGRGYYEAEPLTSGATRISDTEETLKSILENDVNFMNHYKQRIK